MKEDRIITNTSKEYPMYIKICVYKDPIYINDSKPRSKRNPENSDYLSTLQSINRSKTTIRDLCLCNDFDYFITFTFNPKKHDSFDKTHCYVVMSKWIHNQKKNNPFMEYILVPEKHKSGRWHYHALVSNFNGKMVDSGHKTNGRIIYNLAGFRAGFSTAVKIEDKEAVANYITKYITKDMSAVFGERRFFTSKGLNRPIKRRNFPFDLTPTLFTRKTGETDNCQFYEILKFSENVI